MRARQLSFLPALKMPSELAHGGELRKGKRKQIRPYDPGRPLHLILKSSRARGEWSMLSQRHSAWIERELYALARRFRVKVYRFVNVGNHLHLLVQAKRKRDFKAFLKAFSGMIA